jgi:hypothetical protein
LKEAEIVASELVEAREATSIVFELADEALDEVTLLVKLPVVPTLLFAVRPRRNNSFRTHFGDGKKKGIGVVGLVGEDKRRLVVFK